MTVVVSLEDYRPSPRYDAVPWTQARIEEGTASLGPWVTLETQNLSPVDADPANPAYRDFTTALGTAVELWYRIVFLDAGANTGLPTFPVQNVADDRPVYAAVSELAQLLRVNASQRHNSLSICEASASMMAVRLTQFPRTLSTAPIYGCVYPNYHARYTQTPSRRVR